MRMYLPFMILMVTLSKKSHCKEQFVKKYFELIPADKQYGISISRLTESGNSTLICPWDAKYNRTGMYVGIVDGLKN